jgi:D,D-heptose 1,7-bisphosphate phosphatase
MSVSQCVILVGGRGQRLGGLTRVTPKPLLPVSGKPFLDHLIRRAARFGFTDIILLGGFLGEQVQSRYEGTRRVSGRDVSVRVIIEPKPAGTGGALTFLSDVAEENFILMNGDSWIEMDLRNFAEQIVAPGSARVALRRFDDPDRYGSVRLEGERIAEFNASGASSGCVLINSGVYLISRKFVLGIDKVPCSLEHDIFPESARLGTLFGTVVDGFFIDIGVPSDFARASEAIRDNMFRPGVFFDRDGVLNRDGGYTYRTEDLIWNDGAIEAVRQVNAAGWYAFVISNQAGVAHGYYDEADVDRFHRQMDVALAEAGAHIDEFVYCPFHPDGKVLRYRQDSQNRKPRPGMISQLLVDWPVDISRSFAIGDKPIDIEAARAAGMVGYLYEGGPLNQIIEKHLV